MTDANTVVIVSNKGDFLNQISSKLVLLRNLDKVKTSSIEDAQNMFCTLVPNVAILHCKDNDSRIIELIKEIKKQETYKHTSILLINENCSRETVIEAFDSGISDVLFAPVIDYELLIRVIWCLKRNEMSLSLESRNNFLINLGIVQTQDGVYAQKYCDDFLKNEISQTKKYSQRACLLLISPDKKYRTDNNLDDFVSIIKKSIRLNDSVAIKDSDKFYIYLQKTKLNGAYSVFERINSALGDDKGANAGVVEIQEQKFEDIIEALDSALEKANENTNSLIVASDFYSNDKKSIINPENNEQIQNNNMKIEDSESSKNIQKAFDKNSIKLFNQAYERKIKVVLEPVFKKFENILRTKKPDFAVNSYTGKKSLFTVSQGDISASFALEYNGVEDVTIRLTILDNDQKRLFETDTVEFTILDYRKVSLMLNELIDKFMLFLRRKGN